MVELTLKLMQSNAGAYALLPQEGASISLLSTLLASPNLSIWPDIY